MNSGQTLELWEKRFNKLLKLEVESRDFYRLLLKRYSHLLAGTRFQTMIRKIMLDEARHIALAKKLLYIVRKQKARIDTVDA